MNMETFGRSLVAILAERSLAMLRQTSPDDVRRLMNGHLPASLSPSGRSALSGIATAGVAFAAGAAIGVGITALYAPTSGEDLRKKIGREAASARKQAMQIGGDVRERLDGARASIVHGVEQVTTAVGLAAPAAPKRRRSIKKASAMNGHASRSRSSRSAHGAH